MTLFLDNERKAILQDHVDAGDRIAYWSQLSEWGYRYADLALDVVTAETLSGRTANHFLLQQANVEGAAPISNDALATVSLSLMQLDFDLRQAGSGQELSVDAIQDYHEDAFADVGVSEFGWTPTYALNSLETLQEREALWDSILASDNPFEQGFSMMGSLFFNTILPGGDPVEEAQTAVWIAQVTTSTAQAAVTSSNSFGPYSVAIGNGGQAIGGNTDDNTLNGTSGNDVLMGFDGNDRLDGGAGNDRLHDGDGADVLIGGDGNDIFTLTDDDDSDLIIVGGSGFDLIRGGSSIDRIAIAVDDLPPPPTRANFISPGTGDSFNSTDLYSISTNPDVIDAQLNRIGGSGSTEGLAVPILGMIASHANGYQFAENNIGNIGNLGEEGLVFEEVSYSFTDFLGTIIVATSFSFEFYSYADMQNEVSIFSGLSTYSAELPNYSLVLDTYDDLGLQASDSTLFIRLIADETTPEYRDSFESWVVIEDFNTELIDSVQNMENPAPEPIDGVHIGDFGISQSTFTNRDPNGTFHLRSGFLLNPINHIFNNGEYIDINSVPDFGIPDGDGGIFINNDSGDNSDNDGSNNDGGSNNQIIGSDGDDTLFGDEGNDTIYALDGDDTVFAGSGDDIIIAGSGNGFDFYDGETGNDTIIFPSTNEGVIVDLENGFAEGGEIDRDELVSIENVNGGTGDDTLIGNAETNELSGAEGNDTLRGGLGDDILEGGIGVDRFIYANGDGADIILDFDPDEDILDLSATGLTFNELINRAEQQGDDVFIDLSDLENASFADSITLRNVTFNNFSNSNILLTPIAVSDDTGEITEDNMLIINANDLLVNDSNATGIISVQDAVNGTVSLNDDGNVVFVPLQNFNGLASFTYTIVNGDLSSTATVSLLVAAVNDAPIVLTPLADQSSPEDEAVSFALPADAFSDVDGDAFTLSAALVGGAVLPSWLTFDAVAGTFTGTPPQDFNGDLDVVVTASDGEFEASDTFTLSITAVNDAPIVATPLADQSSPEDAAVSFTLPADAFADVDGDALTLSATLADGSELPSWLSFDAESGTFSGVPPQDFNTDDTGGLDISVTASDGELEVSDTFTLQITGVNDNPVANDDGGFELDQNINITITDNALLANDTDVDGDTLLIQSVNGGANGSVELDVDGNVVYTPDAGFVGEDTFTYTVTDGEFTDTATVAVNVNAVDDGNIPDDAIVGSDGGDFIVGTREDDNILGEGGNDVIVSGRGDDTISGGDGNDVAFGGSGADTINGDAGNDILLGGSGRDIITGGEGNDILFGGRGSDTFVFSSGDGRDVIADFSTGYSFRRFFIAGDNITIDVDGVDSFDDLLGFASQEGRHTVLDFGNGDELIIANTQLAALDRDAFTFF